MATKHKERAKDHIVLAAKLLYIFDQPEPKDYAILACVNGLRELMSYVKSETVRHVLSMEEQEFNERVDRMREKGWAAIEGEYISTAHRGDKELDAIEGWTSLALLNIQERKPLEEWSKLIKR